jgi:type II secretory pathway component PulM
MATAVKSAPQPEPTLDDDVSQIQWELSRLKAQLAWIEDYKKDIETQMAACQLKLRTNTSAANSVERLIKSWLPIKRK